MTFAAPHGGAADAAAAAWAAPAAGACALVRMMAGTSPPVYGGAEAGGNGLAAAVPTGAAGPIGYPVACARIPRVGHILLLHALDAQAGYCREYANRLVRLPCLMPPTSHDAAI